MLPGWFKMIRVSHIYSHLLSGTYAGGKLWLAVHNSSAAVTSSGKEQKMRKRMDGNPAPPNSERSQEMHDIWQPYAGMGGRNMHWTDSESPALFGQDGLRRPKVHANTNLESHTCSGSQSWENKSPFQCWLYMALVYSMSQLPWGQNSLSWPLFSTLFKLRALQIKLEVEQKPGNNFTPQWSCLFSLEISTCLPASYLLVAEKCYLFCLGACWVNHYSYFSDLSTGVEFSPPLFSSLSMFNKEKRRLLLVSRNAQAAVKPLLITALNRICLWITHAEHHEICASKNALNECFRN